jgi:hypothetical protein
VLVVFLPCDGLSCYPLNLPIPSYCDPEDAFLNLFDSRGAALNRSDTGDVIANPENQRDAVLKLRTVLDVVLNPLRGRGFPTFVDVIACGFSGVVGFFVWEIFFTEMLQGLFCVSHCQKYSKTLP